jgi:sugar phosphate isomerase/epimerase
MNPMFSCADFTFPLLPHDKVLDLLGLMEFEAVDLGIFEDRSHHFPSEIIQDPMGHAERMKAKLRKRELEVADVFVQTGAEPPVAAVNDPDPAVRKHNAKTMEGMIEYASHLGAKSNG